ncbi:unannotated protein [freshwater metagenome]|uniref:Unannotated protein n=1 Tax=freshwater metagenome TaxID=449393 RepID=A0A6J6TR66_9ZZZZ|nr:hypothetical protein [Actinomycetota bacterium]MSX20363.1 hypothetical protein [Actinomycetota bacterium]MSX70090.1 hypothetical protein [Actinomycetota bacterium]MSY93474.1 hypothetical protein [Actinomycetota bacterium]
MFTKKSVGIISVITLTLIASLTGCSEKTSGLNETPEVIETPIPELALDFGSPLDIGSGIKVTVSTPESFTPGPYASNFIKGQVADRFTVQISNGGTNDFDVTQFTITSSSADGSCIDVLDGDNGIAGAPTDPLVVGADVTFNYAIACNAKVGDPLKISLSSPDVVLALNGTLK